MSPSHIDCAVI